MKKYKPSRYNLFVDFDHDSFQCVVANSFSGTIMFADKELADFLKKFDQAAFGKLKKENESLSSYLIKNDFVVEASLNELERVRIQFEQVKYADRNMHLTIVPTAKCNLGCIYCYEQGAKENSMSLTAQKRLMKFVKARKDILTSLGVTWYGGEPLLEQRTIDNLSRFFIDMAAANGINYSANMITNGTFLNDDMVIEKLLDNKVGHLQVTVDGPEDLHNKRRFYRSGKKESFTDILNGLKKCRGKIPVGIRINVDKTNIQRYRELIDLLCDEKLLGPDSGNVVSLGLVKSWTKKVALTEDKMLSLDDFLSWMKDLDNYLEEKGIPLTKSVDFSPKTPCGAVSVANFLVTPRGGLKNCWIHAAGEGGLVGNLDTGLDLTKSLATKWLAYDPCRDDKCGACSLLPVCAGGCPYEMLKKAKSEYKKEYCEYMSKYVENNLLQSAASKIEQGG